MNEDDPDCGKEFHAWFLHVYDETLSFPGFIVRSDENTF